MGSWRCRGLTAGSGFPQRLSRPPNRAWLLGGGGIVVDGQVVRGQVFVKEMTAYLYPPAAGTRDVPGVVTVVIVPENESCGSGRGGSATAQITYEDGEGRVENLTAEARFASHLNKGTVVLNDWIDVEILRKGD